MFLFDLLVLNLKFVLDRMLLYIFLSLVGILVSYRTDIDIKSATINRPDPFQRGSGRYANMSVGLELN